ncbi:MAG: hypothetical protein AB7O98_13475 [Hyphomonadaceae bacterium]
MFKQASPPKPIARTLAVLIAAFVAIAAPVLIYAAGFGLSAGEFAADGDETLRAAPYAFSIWSLIYVGLGAYAIYQALPATANGRWLDRLGWPSAIAMLGCGLWLYASAIDAKWATVAIIAVSAGVLVRAFWRGGDVGHASARQTWLVLWPLGLLAGWLTIATALNALTVLTAVGVITAEAAPVWAGAGIALVLAAGAAVANRTRLLAYPLPISWGLAAVYMAERSDKPALALAAASAAALLLAFALFRCLRGRKPVAAHS